MKKYNELKINLTQMKKILAYVRQADFAHAGEVQAIERTFLPFEPDIDRLILDAGCGLGGTAHYLHTNHFGKVIGVDLNEESILHAKTHYPEIDFYHGDLLHIKSIIPHLSGLMRKDEMRGKNERETGVYLKANEDLERVFNKADRFSRKPNLFDVICLFNVLYVFEDKKTVLSALRKVANHLSTLVLFAYVDLGYRDNRPDERYDALPAPIKLSEAEKILKHSGWQIKNVVNLNREYDVWYHTFVDNIQAKKSDIIKMSDEETYDYIYYLYFNLHRKIQEGLLGGAIIYAEAY